MIRTCFQTSLRAVSDEDGRMLSFGSNRQTGVVFMYSRIFFIFVNCQLLFFVVALMEVSGGSCDSAAGVGPTRCLLTSCQIYSVNIYIFRYFLYMRPNPFFSFIF